MSTVGKSCNKHLGSNLGSKRRLTMPIVASVLTTIHTTSLSLLLLVATCAPRASDLFFPRSTYPLLSSSSSSKVLVELRTSPFSSAISVSLMSCPFGTLNVVQQSDGLRSRKKEECRHVLVKHGESLHHTMKRVERHGALTCEERRGLGAKWWQCWRVPESRLGYFMFRSGPLQLAIVQ